MTEKNAMQETQGWMYYLREESKKGLSGQVTFEQRTK